MIALSSMVHEGSKRNRLVPLLCFLLLLLFTCILPLWPCLAMTHAGELMLALPLQTNEQFSIRYIHSVNRSPVIDTMQWGGGQELFVRSSLFQAYGAGIPSDADGRGKTIVTEQGILLTDIDTPLRQLSLVTGTIADHYILYRDRAIQLKSIVGEQQRVTFSIRRVNLYSILICAP